MNKEYFKTIYILFKKELMGYFNSPIAYIFIGTFLIVGNWLFFKSFFLIGQTNIRPYFDLLPWMFLFLAPALTMRLWAEEKKSGTIEFLLTIPVTDWQVVLAKFFGSLVFLIVTLLLSITLPITVAGLGNMDIGPVIGGYISSIFLGGAYLSIGLFISSLTKNQIIAFVLGLSACFAMFMIGADFALIGAPKFLVPVMKFFGFGNHFYSMAKGVIDSIDVIYYMSFIALFLWFNTRVIQSREWK
ncbi:ABC transporter permease subunit [Candidatus Parcubacteria bacterium]|nr:ABC transporter permease subunit [Candidatus Parcubacteria bacterium]